MSKVVHWTGRSAESHFRSLESYKPPKFSKAEFMKKWARVRRMLRPHNIFCLKIGWANVWNFIDYAWEDAEEIVRKRMKMKGKYDALDHTSLLFYTDFGMYWALRNGELEIQHRFRKEDKELIVQKFKQVFGTQFTWNGSKSRTMQIKLPKK